MKHQNSEQTLQTIQHSKSIFICWVPFITAVLMLTSCSINVVPQRLYSGPVREATKVARIWNFYGQNNGYYRINDIDGVKSNRFGYSQFVLEVLPGTHTVNLHGQRRQAIPLTWHAQAGKIYTIRPFSQGVPITISPFAVGTIEFQLRIVEWNRSDEPHGGAGWIYEIKD